MRSPSRARRAVAGLSPGRGHTAMPGPRARLRECLAAYASRSENFGFELIPPLPHRLLPFKVVIVFLDEADVLFADTFHRLYPGRGVSRVCLSTKTGQAACEITRSVVLPKRTRPSQSARALT